MLRNGNAGSALTHFKEAAGVEEPHLRYLLGLFEGRAHDREERLDDPIAAYRRAVTAVPGQTAQLALASALARSGRQAEALEMVQTAVRSGPAPPDPWARYGQGDMRMWPGIAGALEAALR
jgi:Flp pilus assembly protein TadD